MTRGSNTMKCYCSAYPYPHRIGGGKCEEREQALKPDEIDLARDELIQQQEKEDEPKSGSDSS